MRLTVVGCAGSFAGPRSPASCYLVQADDAAGRTWSVVLDMGSGAFGALQRVVDPFAIDAVGLSHLHPDHFVDLCGLYVYLRYHPERGAVATGEPGNLAVRGPAATRTRLGVTYGTDDGEDFSGAFRFSRWRPDEPWQVGPLTLTPFAVEHPIEAYAVRVTGPSESGEGSAVLTFSGDTDECAGLVEAASGADLLLVEAAFVEDRDRSRGVHLTGLRAGRAAVAAGARRVVLTHLPAWTAPAAVLAEASSVYGGPLDVAAQGAVYDI